jgi:hypothetical protein
VPGFSAGDFESAAAAEFSLDCSAAVGFFAADVRTVSASAGDDETQDPSELAVTRESIKRFFFMYQPYLDEQYFILLITRGILLLSESMSTYLNFFSNADFAKSSGA